MYKGCGSIVGTSNSIDNASYWIEPWIVNRLTRLAIINDLKFGIKVYV